MTPRFTAMSFARPWRREIRADDQVLALVIAAVPRGQGRTALRLRAPERADVRDQAASGDRWPLTAGVASLQVLPGSVIDAPR